MKKTNKTSARHSGLDLARAIAICLVLCWHLKPVQVAAASNGGIVADVLRFALKQFYYQVTLIAVPAMLLVALYLFYEKMEAGGFAYVRKRCRRIAGLLVFWTGCQFGFYYGVAALTSASNKAALFGSSRGHSLLRLLLEVGPILASPSSVAL